MERAPLHEEAYEAMSAVLFKAELMNEAQMLMERAVELFPTSRNVRYRLGQLYRSMQKTSSDIPNSVGNSSAWSTPIASISPRRAVGSCAPGVIGWRMVAPLPEGEKTLPKIDDLC